MIKANDYLYEKHIQTDEEEPDVNEIIKAIEWAEQIDEDLQPMEADENPEWGMCYHEDLR